MQLSIGSFYPVLLLSGILWPVEGMPAVLQSISWYLPCTCACQAMRDIMSRGWGVEGRISVQLGLLSSTAWIAIFLLASIVLLKIQQRAA
jgi:ABC-type multidrug transport system permease subunit